MIKLRDMEISPRLGHPFVMHPVDNILNKNLNSIVVPCHRIICSNGKLSGYAYGSAVKRELLEMERNNFIKGL
jgi:methylated-DNA-[protein]-cysteine S-methyltransferase